MPIAALYSPIGLLVLACALLVSCLLYWKNIKTKIVPIANLTMVLVFMVSVLMLIMLLAKGLEDPAEITRTVGASLIMDFYAGFVNVAARVWVRVRELMGNKRIKISVHAELVEK